MGPTKRDRDVCAEKKAFPTKAHALRIGIKHNQYAYECPVCFCWHLTKREKAS